MLCWPQFCRRISKTCFNGMKFVRTPSDFVPSSHFMKTGSPWIKYLFNSCLGMGCKWRSNGWGGLFDFSVPIIGHIHVQAYSFLENLKHAANTQNICIPSFVNWTYNVVVDTSVLCFGDTRF
jgi:hypothetical protein